MEQNTNCQLTRVSVTFVPRFCFYVCFSRLFFLGIFDSVHVLVAARTTIIYLVTTALIIRISNYNKC